MTLTGKRLRFKYRSGLEVAGIYEAGSVAWEAFTGPAQGSKGTERTHAAEIAPGIHFVSWVEASGTTVSQVIDLNALAVWCFVTYDTGSGREAMLDSGSVVVEGR